MSISGVSSLIPKIPTATIVSDAPNEAPETEETPKVQPIEEGQASVETSADDSGGETTDIPGVLAHLSSGHFKGVAQVRLLANFHAELEELERQDILVAVEGQASTFTTIVDAQLTTILSLLATRDSDGEEDPLDEVNTPQTLNESLEAEGLTVKQVTEASEATEPAAEPGEVVDPAEVLLANAQKSFEEAVVDAFDAFNGFEDTDSVTLSGDLRAAFDNLLGSLNELLVSEPDPAAESAEPSEPIASIEEGDVISTPQIEEAQSAEPVEETDAAATLNEQYQALIDELSSVLYSALEDLDAAIKAAEFNPELNEPTGNGVAYDKFLAIYKDLQSAGETAETDSSIEAGADEIIGIDIEV